MSAFENLSCWPRFKVLLGDYLSKLESIEQESGEPWLVGAARLAGTRSEVSAQFAALELAASTCDQESSEALSARFGEILAGPGSHTSEKDAQLLDALVELVAHGYLRREYPDAQLRFVPREDHQKTPDLELLVDDRSTGIECKNLGMSKDASEALGPGEVISGHGGIPGGFVNKLGSAVSRAMEQLDQYDGKIIFLNYAPDPQLWAAEEVEPDAVRAALQRAVPTGAALVVFRNYDWSVPYLRFDS